MPDAIPTQEQLAIWAAEELWDWRVRILFGVVCAIAVLVVLVIYLAWGKDDGGESYGRARRYMGRVSTTLLVIAAGEALFFKDVVSTLLLVGTSAVLGAAALNMAPDGLEAPEAACVDEGCEEDGLGG